MHEDEFFDTKSQKSYILSSYSTMGEAVDQRWSSFLFTASIFYCKNMTRSTDYF